MNCNASRVPGRSLKAYAAESICCSIGVGALTDAAIIGRHTRCPC